MRDSKMTTEKISTRIGSDSPPSVPSGTARPAEPIWVRNGGTSSVKHTHHFCGLRSNLIHGKHIEKMGAAIWLFAWLVSRETSEASGIGVVWFGKPMSYKWIAEEMETNERLIRRWMDRLREQGYIHTIRTSLGLCVKILNAKRYRYERYTEKVINKISTEQVTKNGQSECPNMVNQCDQKRSITLLQVPENNDDAVSLSNRTILSVISKELKKTAKIPFSAREKSNLSIEQERQRQLAAFDEYVKEKRLAH